MLLAGVEADVPSSSASYLVVQLLEAVGCSLCLTHEQRRLQRTKGSYVDVGSVSCESG